MMGFSYEKRSLKRPRLGPPDVYPQDPKQKEVCDESVERWVHKFNLQSCFEVINSELFKDNVL